MSQPTVGRTALGAAICRLIEQYQPEKTRLIDDPVVMEMVGAPIRFPMQFSRMRSFTIRQANAMLNGVYGAQICRTRYIDDGVLAALSRGIDQLVILGAGFDTRAYRLPGFERVRVFEVDLPAAQEDKKEKLTRRFGRLPEHVTFIPIDFDAQTLVDVIAGKPFDQSRPVVFIWEGVTQYLSEDAVCQTLTFIGKSVPGSALLFTYVLKSIVEHRSGIPSADKMLDVVAKNDAPWVFGLEPTEIAAFLKQFHLTLVEDVGNADYQEKNIRPAGRNLVVSEVERVVRAVV